jgi:hypothetical protein
VSLCTSSPAHRSTSTSISRPSLRLEPGVAARGASAYRRL